MKRPIDDRLLDPSSVSRPPSTVLFVMLGNRWFRVGEHVKVPIIIDSDQLRAL